MLFYNLFQFGLHMIFNVFSSFIHCFNTEYVEQFYQTYLEGERCKLLTATPEELRAQSPPPMNSMLKKEKRRLQWKEEKPDK